MRLPVRELDWPKLRRDLEEILSIIKASTDDAHLNRGPSDPTVESPEPTAAHEHRAEPERACPPEPNKNNRPDKNDLYNDAIVMLTEFGQLSPSILQMWLSIDYSDAMTIMNRFQTEGLISPKGRVRHKAFSLRRMLNQEAL